MCTALPGGAGNDMAEETRQALIHRGVPVVTAAHALSGAERALSGMSGGVFPVEIVAHTLRMLGQGVKVAVETATMVCDAGLSSRGSGSSPWAVPAAAWIPR